MKIINTKILAFLILISSFSCTNKSEEKQNSYIPEDKALFDIVMGLDSIYFNAYNTCDLETQKGMIPDDFEFYHDRGGLMTSKEAFIKALKTNICGKVTRTLIEGSVEVYPINNYGAIQTGLHKFFNNQEPDAISKPSKFIVIWKKEDSTWKMARVVSLH